MSQPSDATEPSSGNAAGDESRSRTDAGMIDPSAQTLAPLPPSELAPTLEALLLMAEEPLSTAILAEATGTPEPHVKAELERLVSFYDETGRGFQLRHIAGGWSYYTRPEQRERIAAWVKAGGQNRLSQAAMETLAVVAYLQPVPRSRGSAVRGVYVGGVVRTLLSRGLIDEQGTDNQSGAGLLVTTDYFLTRLGLGALSDLPDIAPLLPDAATLEAELASLAEPTGQGAEHRDSGQADDASVEHGDPAGDDGRLRADDRPDSSHTDNSPNGD